MGSTNGMAEANASSGASGFPEILSTLLELVQHSDNDLSWKVSLALKFFLERECISGDAEWLSTVEAFLAFEDNLAVTVGSRSIKELRISPKERDNFAYEIFSRIERKATNAWRHAYILKQAICVPGLQDDVVDYLHANWSVDEEVTSHLLYVVWAVEKSVNFNATLNDISENAMSQELREQAAQTLRVRREVEAWQAQNLEQ